MGHLLWQNHVGCFDLCFGIGCIYLSSSLYNPSKICQPSLSSSCLTASWALRLSPKLHRLVVCFLMVMLIRISLPSPGRLTGHSLLLLFQIGFKCSISCYCRYSVCLACVLWCCSGSMIYDWFLILFHNKDICFTDAQNLDAWLSYSGFAWKHSD